MKSGWENAGSNEDDRAVKLMVRTILPPPRHGLVERESEPIAVEKSNSEAIQREISSLASQVATIQQRMQKLADACQPGPQAPDPAPVGKGSHGPPKRLERPNRRLAGLRSATPSHPCGAEEKPAQGSGRGVRGVLWPVLACVGAILSIMIVASLTKRSSQESPSAKTASAPISWDQFITSRPPGVHVFTLDARLDFAYRTPFNDPKRYVCLRLDRFDQALVGFVERNSPTGKEIVERFRGRATHGAAITLRLALEFPVGTGDPTVFVTRLVDEPGGAAVASRS